MPSGQQAPQTAYRPGSGLLSGWKAGLANPVSQQAMQGPVTGPTINPGAVPMQASSLAQPFTYQTGSTPEPMQPLHANGYNYASGNATIQSFPQSGQYQVQPPPAMMPMPGATASPFQQSISGLQNMAPVATMAPAPLSPLAPNPQHVDPFGKPLYPAPTMPQQANGWTQWPQGPSGDYPGYQPPFGPGGPGGPGGRNPGGPTKLKKRKKRRVPIWARVVLSILVVLLIAAGGGFYYYQVNFAQSVSHITGQQVARYKGEDDPNQGQRSSGDILSGGRINILLLGSDTDEKFQGTYLAQTDIVVTIDPKTNYVGMLSIPRDTWLNSAGGRGMMKLDQAYGRGGIGLSRATIYQDFGIPINYYAWVGLNGFIKVVDTAQGVDIDAIHPITDDAYPDDTGAGKSKYDNGYKRLYIAAGPQHMDGMTALEYVRSRHADLVGDFGRSQRQQQLLSALKLKLNNPNIIGELPQLAQDLNGYVTTDMQLTDVFKLMYFARSLNQNQIKQVILSGQYSHTVPNYPTAYGAQDIVVLNCATVLPVISTMFGLGDQARCDTGISSTGTPVSTGTAAVQAPSASAISSALAQTTSADSLWQVTQQMSTVNSMSYSDGSSSLYGVRGLIDLLCMTVFESPIGMQA